jgi:hypothetical protein
MRITYLLVLMLFLTSCYRHTPTSFNNESLLESEINHDNNEPHFTANILESELNTDELELDTDDNGLELDIYNNEPCSILDMFELEDDKSSRSVQTALL